MQRYSCLRFQMDITEDTPNLLISLIKQGVKVFFFTYDPIDGLLNNELIRKAKEENFLLIYETFFNEELTSDFTYYDGNVPDDILDILAESTPDIPFNKEQFKVEHSDLNQNIIVSAGAGTGKTTVMIDRIMYLKFRQEGMNFSDIGLITFTNKAAAQLREKLVEKIKLYFYFTNDFKYLNWLRECNEMTIGTIHSFAYEILKQNQSYLFDRTNLPISQFNYERRKIIEETINEFHENYPKKFSKFKYIEQYKVIQVIEAIIEQINNFSISNEKIETVDFGESEDHSHEFFEYIVKETVKRLDQFKIEKEFLDVHDLIKKLEGLITSDEKYNVPFKYIFIDEFQDTDTYQTHFFAHLTNYFPVNLFVVGDIKQSIYRFRGADYTAFKQLNDQVIIDQYYYLQLNYRSNKQLLTEFNDLFSKWPKVVNTFKYEKDDYLLPGSNKESAAETNIINLDTDTIDFLRKMENTDTAVLVRSNKEVNELARECENNSIFYTAEQDGDFYRSLPVREFYQLILRYAQPGIWKNRYLLHISSYGERKLKTKDIVENFSADRLNDGSLKKLDRTLEKYKKEFKKRPVFEVLNDIIQEINPGKVYTERFMTDRSHISNYPNDRLNADIIHQEYNLNLEHLLYLLKIELENTIPTLNNIEKTLRLKMQTDKFISRITVDSNNDHRLKIMTVHKAKGLQFDNVFLPDTSKPFNKFSKMDVLLKNNLLGYSMSIDKGKVFINNHYSDLRGEERAEDIGEETRLLYVALTRAKENVYYKGPSNTNNHNVRKWGDLFANSLTEKSKIESFI